MRNNNNNNKRNKSQPKPKAKKLNQQNNNKKQTKQNKKLKKTITNLNALLRNLNVPMINRTYNKGIIKTQGWNHTKMPGLKGQVNEYHDNSLAEYVYGITHPDVVYRNNLNIKCPSIIPIPTTNFAFKETFTLNTNDKGNFLIIWNPNYLGSSDGIQKVLGPSIPSPLPDWFPNAYGVFSNLYWTNDNFLDGNSPAQDIRAQTFKRVVQPFNKYRLTSACIKVMYTGPVLDQSGTMSACASFMEFPRTGMLMNSASDPPATYMIPQQFTQLSRLGDFDTIRQGQWARTVNIVNDPKGITCVYIPTDSLSQAFVDNADTITAKDILPYALNAANMRGVTWKSRAANISFPICGAGIKKGSTDVITVECYYNYEIIVHEEQLPYFRPTVQQMNNKQIEQVTKDVDQVASTVGTIVRTETHENPSIMSRIANALGYVGKVSSEIFNSIGPLMKLGEALF